MFFWITTPCILITHLYNVTFLIRVSFNFLNIARNASTNPLLMLYLFFD